MKAYQAFIPLPTGEGEKTSGASLYAVNLNKSSMKRAECYNLGLETTYAAREAPITLELSIGCVGLKPCHGR
jgi:hypothetical protein